MNQKNQSTQLYTCPMHPEIIQNHSGSCPICGMSLEVKAITKDIQTNPELLDFTRRFWISVILSIPLLILTMGAMLPFLSTWIKLIPNQVSNWFQFFLSTPVVFYCGWPLLTRGYQSLANRRLNMFTLITLGVLIAYGFSFAAMFFPDFFPDSFKDTEGNMPLYFESAAMITVLVLLGQILELKGREKTGGALRALLNLAPQKTTRILKNAGEEIISIDQVQKNDHLKIRPGEKIPVDGKVIQGESTVDESMISGESMPVRKTPNDQVIGGTVNQHGSIIMEALYVGDETMLAQIIKQVAIAERSRAPIQRFADWIAGYFVPAVILIAFFTFIIWSIYGPQPSALHGVIAAISVLIIACPCALGLATPMSIMVGMGRGAQKGILIKNAESLEQFEKVNLLIVDKTGTLTSGKPTVDRIITNDSYTKNDILFFAASLEKNSEHPLAHAIVNEAKQQDIKLDTPHNFQAEVGKGIRGNIKNQTVAMGNLAMLKFLKVELNILQDEADQLREEGKSVMFVIINQTIAGLISVSDPIKKSSKKAVSLLQKQGIKLVMVTGDHAKTANFIGKELGIDDIQSDVLPNQKNEIVQSFQQKGLVVAMAGDGINDAAALAEANIGIAMGTGTDIAIESADITLVKGDLTGIVHARELSQTVMRNIRENLFLAFAYNVLCIPIAAGALYPVWGLLLNPMISALAMSLSSLSVVLNALRLRRFRFSTLS